MPKIFTIASHLPTPSISQPLSQTAPNSVIQLPHTPHAHAIDIIIDRIPDPHQPPPPNLLLRPAQHNILTHIPTIQSSSNPITVISDSFQIQRPTPNASIPFDVPLPSIPLPPTTPGLLQPTPTPITQDPSPPHPDTIPRTPVSTLIPPPNIITTSRPTRSRLPPGIWKGACISSSSTTFLLNNPARTTAVHRKIQLARLAAIRNRHHRLNHPTSLNNRATHIQPAPIPNQQSEMSIRRAKSIFPAAEISSGISKELGKHFDTYKSLKLIPRSCIEEKAVFLRSQIFLKKKSNGLITARLAIDGSRQPRSTYNDTYAGTSDTTNRAFILQAYLADAAHRGCLDRLHIGDFNFPGAFLHNPLTRKMTNGHQLIATLPSDLPSPLAGQLAEIIGCCYGIKQANHEFDKDLTLLLTNAGFIPTSSDHHSFHKRCPDNPLDSLTLNMHVDDGWHITSSSVSLLNVFSHTHLQLHFPETPSKCRDTQHFINIILVIVSHHLAFAAGNATHFSHNSHKLINNSVSPFRLLTFRPISDNCL